MFTEPQAITVNAVGDSLPRTSFSPKGVFTNAATGRTLSIHQLAGKRNRRTIRLDITKTAADPLLDGVSKPYSMSAYLVIDHPQVGFDTTEAAYNVRALVDWCDVAGNIEKVLGGES